MPHKLGSSLPIYEFHWRAVIVASVLRRRCPKEGSHSRENQWNSIELPRGWRLLAFSVGSIVQRFFARLQPFGWYFYFAANSLNSKHIVDPAAELVWDEIADDAGTVARC